MTVLLFEDKLGITDGYLGLWSQLLLQTGHRPENFKRVSVWKSSFAMQQALLIKSGNRKTPGFNPDAGVQSLVRARINPMVDMAGYRYIVCMDSALLGLVESDWNAATIDNMRGGLYAYRGKPFFVITPISAIHTKRQEKDIRSMNQGVENLEEWNEFEHNPEELYIEPYVVKAGRWILYKDLQKLKRIMEKIG